MNKVCRKCGLEKTLDAFHNDKKRKDGKYPNCKICTNAHARSRDKIPEIYEKRKARQKNKILNDPEYKSRANLRSIKFYQSVEGRAATLFNNAKKSPSGKSKEFSITVEYILQQLLKGQCAVTGVKFEFDNAHQLFFGRKKNPYSPSIDRIDPRLGYTKQNTRIVIWWYNMAKGELSDVEMAHLCQIVSRSK